MPALTIKGPSLLRTSTMAEDSRPQPSPRKLIVKPGFDITIHVEEKENEQGESPQDAEPCTTVLSRQEFEHAMRTLGNPSLRATELPLPSNNTKKREEVSTTQATKDNKSFSSIYESRSRVATSTTKSVLPTYQSQNHRYGRVSRGQLQQPTPTPALVIGGQRYDSGPVAMTFLWIFVMVLAVGVIFAVHVYSIVIHRISPVSAIWNCFRKRKDTITGRHEKEDNKSHKRSSPRRSRESSFANSRLNSLYEMHQLPRIPSSPPQTPKMPSYPTFPCPQATTSSSAYSTPAATPVESMFPSSSIFRHRQTHIPPSLSINSTSPTTTGLDLENQTPAPTPTLAYFRSPPLSISRDDKSLSERKERYSLPRARSAGWVAGAVDKVAEGLVRYTRDDGSGLLLPLRQERGGFERDFC